MTRKSTTADRTAGSAHQQRLSFAAAQADERADAAKRQVRLAKARLKRARKAAKAAKKAAKQARKQLDGAKSRVRAARRAGTSVRKAGPATRKAAVPRKRAPRTARLHPAAAVARSVIKRLNAAASLAALPSSALTVAPGPTPAAPAGIPG